MCLFIVLVLLGCGPAEPPEQNVSEVKVEPFLPPTDEQVRAIITEMGGLAIGVTNPNLFVVNQTRLIAYKVDPEGSCRVRVQVEGHLTEPLVTLNAVYDVSQTLSYESEYRLRRSEEGWKYATLVEANMLAFPESDLQLSSDEQRSATE
ncbi:MAG TPA: hypothetical protein PKH07_11515 [bacterium]|nr:hypothetical protein [bacterium]